MGTTTRRIRATVKAQHTEPAPTTKKPNKAVKMAFGFEGMRMTDAGKILPRNRSHRGHRES